MTKTNKGIWYALGAYICWGVFPLYFMRLRQVPALELISHRIVWSCLMLCGVLLLTRQWRAFCASVPRPRVISTYLIASVLIGINWGVFLWAIIANRIIEVSLGYFLSPIVNVLMGALFLRERLRPWQWVSIALAGAGVLYLIHAYGGLPWIALGLALSFGIYGLVKKGAPLPSLDGLTLETAFLFPPALGYLLYTGAAGEGVFLHGGTTLDLLLIGSGVATAIPLLLFASASQRIPLWQLGMLQYLAPTLQFLLGILVFNEAVTTTQLTGFALIWTALLIFALEGYLSARGQPAAAKV
jgi:chloramphenicol-sensitive protein RarD